MLFTPYRLGEIELKNRVVMSPMTRNRAPGNVPNALMARYYAQRAGAGLIVTEGTSPSPNGLGYARIPGIYSPAQVDGWRLVTDAVHAAGGRIFVQLMHTGRITHPANLPPGAEVVAPSAVAAREQMWTDSDGMQPLPTPRAMTLADVAAAREEYVRASRNALEAGFDGVEFHAANGYLLEQFIHPETNRRTDAYGGSIEGRCRFVLEVAAGAAAAIGGDRVGIRLSPYGVFNDMPHYDEIDAAYTYLARELDAAGLVYVHLVDHSAMGAPPVDAGTVRAIREAVSRTLILSGGYDRERAERDLLTGRANLVAFGRPFIANPDLPRRMAEGAPIAAPDPATFYTPGEQGYADYPAFTP